MLDLTTAAAAAAAAELTADGETVDLSLFFKAAIAAAAAAAATTVFEVLDRTKAAGFNPDEDELPIAAAVEHLSPLGLATVAFFKVDILGLPEELCLGECVPNGDFGLFEATGECLGLGRVVREDPVTQEANKPPLEPFGDEEGDENLRATAPAAASLDPAGEFCREYIFSGGPIGESSRFFLRFFSFGNSPWTSKARLAEVVDEGRLEMQVLEVVDDFLSLLLTPLMFIEELPVLIGVMVMPVDELLTVVELPLLTVPAMLLCCWPVKDPPSPLFIHPPPPPPTPPPPPPGSFETPAILKFPGANTGTSKPDCDSLAKLTVGSICNLLADDASRFTVTLNPTCLLCNKSKDRDCKDFDSRLPSQFTSLHIVTQQRFSSIQLNPRGKL
uniref:Uncharacterized protein n=1 Tax=Glossina pallidipes TaxID=7398 RepID=A0A1B0AIG6_GLOPL